MKDILADTVVMVRPKAFGFNPETEGSNAFQKPLGDLSASEARKLARDEFDGMVKALEGAGVTVLAFEDLNEPETPDAVFPNNWFCTHPGGPILTFPMESPTRRLERREDILAQIQGALHAPLDRSLEGGELDGAYLEGTGSLILDHQNKLAYAAISTRTHMETLKKYEKLSGYQVVPFKAFGPAGEPIYHTNVMMCLGPDFAMIGADTLEAGDKARILDLLEKSGKGVLKLTNEQVYNHFAGNMLCLGSKTGQRILVMSATARASLGASQKDTIRKTFRCEIVSSPIPTLERLGGGSARCMIAEIFH